MIPYKEREIFYTHDGRLMDGQLAIMMDWEKPIMEFQARQICRNGGDILNVGFGMGFFDDEVQRQNINSHHIIEIHPTVQKEMINRGWDKKQNVTLHFGDWREVMESLPKFDGIYIDTWDEHIHDFIRYSPNILKKGGCLSYFNNHKDDFDRDGLSDYVFNLIGDKFDVRIESIIIPKIDGPERQTGKSDDAYWWEKDNIYNSPLLILR